MPPVNPEFETQSPPPPFDVDDLFEGLQQGDAAALSRGITLIESTLEEHRQLAEELLTLCDKLDTTSLRLAITGIPGVGKSTLIEALGSRILDGGYSLAVLAIDPSSERSGGSILGDKTRMQRLSTHQDAYVRASPTRGTLGGVSQTTREAMLLCEAAGYSHIIVETVGVGQAEISVHQMVDCFILLFIAGAGDSLQGIKRGIMEMADILAVNKADGANEDAAASVQNTLQQVQELLPAPKSGWKPTVALCSALEDRGIDELWETIQEFTDYVKETGYFERHRQEQRAHWFHALTREGLLHDFYQNKNVHRLLETLETRVLRGDITPLSASREALAAYLHEKPES